MAGASLAVAGASLAVAGASLAVAGASLAVRCLRQSCRTSLAKPLRTIFAKGAYKFQTSSQPGSCRQHKPVSEHATSPTPAGSVLTRPNEITELELFG